MSFYNINSDYYVVKKRAYEDSPLSQEGLQNRKKIKYTQTGLQNLRLSFQSLLFPSKLSLLSKKYGIDFQSMAPLKKSDDLFYDMIDQITLIEESLSLNRIQESEKCREKIREIISLSHSSLEEKIAELGLIYYYLDRDKIFIPQKSYILCRAEEIQTEVDRLKEEHDDLFEEDKNALITGRISYLLRTFSHMVVSSEQKFNLGGAYALFFILQNLNLKVAYNLQPEHRDHILCIAKNLIEKKQFKALLEKPFSICQDLEEMIQVDHKLSPDVKVTSIDVIWDCMMFLFFDIRQLSQPNCYAIASLNYVNENATYKIIENILKWLQDGYFKVDGLKVPILPLLQKRLSFSNKGQFEPKRALSSAIFQKILNSLNFYDLLEEKDTKQDVETILENLAQENWAEEKLPYAKKILYSFNHNFLSHMVLAIMEFQSNGLLKQKSNFIEHCLNFISDSIPLSQLGKSETQILLETLKNSLTRKIWFADSSRYNSKKIGEKELQVDSLDQSQTISFSGDLDDLVEALCEGSYLFFYDESTFVFIEKISEFQKAFIKVIEGAEKKCESQGYQCSEISKILQKIVLTKPFAKFIAKKEAQSFEKKGLKSRSLLKSDLLIFAQQGGRPKMFLEKMGVSYEIKGFKEKEPRAFLTQLSAALKKIDRPILEKPSCLLCSNQKHCYTFYPQYHLEILDSKNITEYLNSIIYTPLNAFLNTPSSSETENRVFEKLHSSKLKVKWETFCKSKMELKVTNEDFCNFLLDNVKTDRCETVIDRAFYSVRLSENDLWRLCSNLGILIDLDYVKILIQELNFKTNDSPAPPYVIARKLSKIFMEHGLASFHSHQLEKEICLLTHLPQSIVIGDLNWCDEKEAPYHIKLTIRYHFGQKKLVFMQRGRSQEQIYDDDGFEQTIIWHPKY